jgi:hypothetical protein
VNNVFSIEEQHEAIMGRSIEHTKDIISIKENKSRDGSLRNSINHKINR